MTPSIDVHLFPNSDKLSFQFVPSDWDAGTIWLHMAPRNGPLRVCIAFNSVDKIEEWAGDVIAAAKAWQHARMAEALDAEERLDAAAYMGRDPEKLRADLDDADTRR